MHGVTVQVFETEPSSLLFPGVCPPAYYTPPIDGVEIEGRGAEDARVRILRMPLSDSRRDFAAESGSNGVIALLAGK